MQLRWSKSTIPSSRWYMAEVGQIDTQGGLLQWLQRVTWKWRRVSGNWPTSVVLTQVR